MVRCGVVKMGGRLKDIVEAKGVVEWRPGRGRVLRNYVEEGGKAGERADA